jgi:hypothetical protein
MAPDRCGLSPALAGQECTPQRQSRCAGTPRAGTEFTGQPDSFEAHGLHAFLIETEGVPELMEQGGGDLLA